MMDRMKDNNTLVSKMNMKLTEAKNLTSYELYQENSCNSYFLCETMSKINETGFKQVTNLDRIILLIDLVTLEAIDLGKREDTLEMVLQVIKVKGVEK